MTANSNTLLWPAIAAGAGDLPSAISCERGIWGKVHASPADFHWIAMTPGFSGPSRHFEHELPLGAEDAPVRATLWRVIGDLCHAVSLVPSGALDATGRTGFVEKHVLEWRRPPNVPAAAGALLLLPAAARFDAIDWSEPRDDVRWSDDDIDALDPVPPLPLALDAALAEGLRALTQATTEEALAELYSNLLAGNRAVTLAGAVEPLPPEALAALLLPLPRDVADTVSIAGWLPSTWISQGDAAAIERKWHVVIGGKATEHSSPSPEHLAQGQTMAQSIFRQRPPHPMHTERSATAPSSSEKSVRLALWGPAAAGKTALVANLFLDANDTQWAVFPTQQSLGYVDKLRGRMKLGNHFPVATRIGEPQGIEYYFEHRASGTVALLQLEDRAGTESETVEDEATGGAVSLKRRLGAADGLVVLFDPTKEPHHLASLVSRTFELLHVASGRKTGRDPRPIAVCVSKADLLIENPDDFRKAVESPDEFVRERVTSVVGAIDRYCSNYRFFPLSAAGVRLRLGIIEPVVFIDEALEPRICPGGIPFNLMAPFTWLLNQLTGVA
jgi:hypothetical protein